MEHNTNGNGSQSIPVGDEKQQYIITRPKNKKDRLWDKTQTPFNSKAPEPDMMDSTSSVGRAVSRSNANATANANGNSNPSGSSNAVMNRQGTTSIMTMLKTQRLLAIPWMI